MYPKSPNLANIEAQEGIHRSGLGEVGELAALRQSCVHRAYGIRSALVSGRCASIGLRRNCASHASLSMNGNSGW